MKKIFFALAFLCLTKLTFAQTINFGIKGGVNLSTLSASSPQYPVYGKNITGFNVGGIVDVGYSKFLIQTGLFYSTKGEKITGTLVNADQQPAGSFSIVDRINYLELPINFLYKINLIPTIKLHLGGGPYLGYQISGTVTDNEQNTITQFHSNYRNPDYGVNFLAGIDLREKFIIDAGYGLGLADLNSYSTLKNRVISFSVGYLIK